MECEKCGAETVEGAETCAECGEPMVAAAESTDAPVEATEAAAVETDAPVEATDIATGPATSDVPSAEPVQPSAGRPAWMTALIVIVVLAVLGAGGYFGWQAIANAGNDPKSAALRLLDAYAAYDAKGILDNATHGNLPDSGVKEFEKQAVDAKKQANGKAGVKDYSVTKVTMDPKNANQASVEIAGKWLTDSAKGTYTDRAETLQLVKENNKWLVRLFF
ncbi:MAG: hypothetical protein Q7W30_00895 [Coriobacteriia bacterium]|nr:hypothetical protein [Coriobacteriia bacterium]